ncbi:hypothetical protein A3Q56_08721 [Intoshia linei]|uniref:Uncharacterized protein n=1 Tax=Intoshia linei TaxID=1819745 RepID=A0A177AQ91_9BILA|nr:hypothetical protein A3Q56_08721 [Intoshia linei]
MGRFYRNTLQTYTSNELKVVIYEKYVTLADTSDETQFYFAIGTKSIYLQNMHGVVFLNVEQGKNWSYQWNDNVLKIKVPGKSPKTFLIKLNLEARVVLGQHYRIHAVTSTLTAMKPPPAKKTKCNQNQ